MPAPIILFHIVVLDVWKSSKLEYAPVSLSKEGFIHFSTRDQVIDTANTYFKGVKGLGLLEIEVLENDAKLRWEEAAPLEGSVKRAGDFPHYYGPLSKKHVRRVHEFKPTADGSFRFP